MSDIKTVQVKLDMETHKAVRHAAVEEDMTPSQWIAEYLNQTFGEEAKSKSTKKKRSRRASQEQSEEQ